jgi:hypothetical protein
VNREAELEALSRVACSDLLNEAFMTFAEPVRAGHSPAKRQ